MLGDIVPNNTNPNTAAPAAPPAPQPQPVTGGYGAASFGPAQPAANAQPQAFRPQAAPVQPVQMTAPAAAPVSPAAPAAIIPPEATDDEVRSVAPLKGRGPLILTVVGVIVFISGVSGLFIYALSGS